jgi:patatin-like phospholipase/acyl hydrolase
VSRSRFQVLALDGGGVKALFAADVLARIEEDLGVSIRDTFDLIAGTSAGGIIALALGAGFSPAEIVEDYQSLVNRVFPPSRRRKVRLPLRLLRTTYQQEPLREALHELLGPRLLGDSDKRLVIPSWDAQNGSVHIFKTRHHPRLNRDWKIPMVDVALATSAAPTYLPAAVVDGHRLIDGGVWANNPSVVAITESLSMLNVDADAIRLLNIGTTSALADHPRRLDDAGLGPWARRAPELIMAAGSRGTQGIAEHLLTKGRYFRFDATVPRGSYTLDGADPKELAGISAKVSRDLSPVFHSVFSGYTAGDFHSTPRLSQEKESA